jgi:hypothetical protein
MFSSKLRHLINNIPNLFYKFPLVEALNMQPTGFKCKQCGSCCINLIAGDAVLMDPFVVNFDGRASELSNMNFSFDIDSDGVKEDVPMIRPGSGFLALDLVV